jgi:general secretion pathway protein J
MRARGFTLLEMLAALALLALLLAGVWSGISAATRTIRAGQAAAARIELLRAAQGYLRRELQEAQPLPWTKTHEGNDVTFDGTARRVRFVAPLPGYLGRLGSQLQTVELVPDGENLRLQVQLAELSPDGGPPVPIGKPQVLLHGIVAGRFQYRGYDARMRPLPWQADWPMAGRLPVLVRLQLQLKHGRSWPTLTVPLRVDGAAPGVVMRAFQRSPERVN